MLQCFVHIFMLLIFVVVVVVVVVHFENYDVYTCAYFASRDSPMCYGRESFCYHKRIINNLITNKNVKKVNKKWKNIANDKTSSTAIAYGR